MKVKTLIAALAVAAGVTPMAAVAKAGCNDMQKQASLSCPAGQSWDAATQKCVVLDS